LLDWIMEMRTICFFIGNDLLNEEGVCCAEKRPLGKAGKNGGEAITRRFYSWQPFGTEGDLSAFDASCQ